MGNGMTELPHKQQTKKPLPSCHLRVVDGPGRGGGRLFTQRRICLGRDDSNDFVLGAPSVSGHHLTLHYEEGRGYRLVDESSTNGVWIGNVRVEQAMICSETTFQVGDLMLCLQPREEDASGTFTWPQAAHTEDAPPSSQMLDLMGKTARLARVSVPVLFLGETGTGKGTIAAQLHQLSHRHEQPFVHVNCAAIPRELFEAEMFGYKQGAFTGARRDHGGFFKQADGGTLFLDEIGELAKEHQSKLLTVLDRGEYRPVGARQSEKARFRLLTATNRDLHAEIKEGRFREDLYYRIAVYELRLPPLRERLDDINYFAALFLEEFLRENPERRPLSFATGTIEVLRGCSWPGNIRQLRHAIFAAATQTAMEPGELRSMIEVDDISSPLRHARRAHGTSYQMPTLTTPTQADKGGEFPRYEDEKRRLLDEFKRAYMRQLFEHTSHNISQASELSGLNRSYIYTIKKELLL